MRRRHFITLVGSAALFPTAARAQKGTSSRRVGVLLVGLSPDSKEAQQFRQGLRDAGYIDGRNVIIEWRSANGDYARVPELIADLVQSGVEVIVMDSTVGTQVAMTTAPNIPIVMALVVDPVGSALMSYGPDLHDLFRRSALYVDRILKGGKPAEIPVEQPTKFEFVVNLTTAKMLGLDIPPALLSLADDLIE